MVLVSSVKDTLSACVPQTTKCIEHQLGTKKKDKNAAQHWKHGQFNQCELRERIYKEKAVRLLN